MEKVKVKLSLKDLGVKIIPQTYLMQDGNTVGRSYAVFVHGAARCVFYSESELASFLEALQ